MPQQIAPPADDEDAKIQCEKLFQSGGSKVYFQDAPGGHLYPSRVSARQTVAGLFRGQVVWARLKARGTKTYSWCKLTGTADTPAARFNRKAAEAAKVARTSPTVAVVKGGVMVEEPNPAFKATARGFPMPADIRVGETLQAYVKRVGVANVPVVTLAAMDMKPPKVKNSDTSVLTEGFNASGLTFTAMDMGRAVFQSDMWPPRKQAPLTSAADICSYITRVLFGRNLLAGRGPIRVDLENGHHLLVTMRKDGDTQTDLERAKADIVAAIEATLIERAQLSKQHAQSLAWAVRQACSAEALQAAINDDRGPQHRKRAKAARAALKELTT